MRAAAAVVATVGTCMGLALVTATGAAPASGAATNVLAYWQMDEARGAKVMVDSGPNRIDGTIGTLVQPGQRVNGATAYHWNYVRPKTPPPNPQRLVQVDDSRLNPGSADYAVELRFRATAGNSNLIQKGQSGTRGGYFKVEIHQGKVACVYRGTVRQRGLWSANRLNDGAWHTIRCARDSDGIVFTVDGKSVKRLKGWTGPIANTFPLTVGGKISCNEKNVTCDYFAGDIDWIRIETG